MLFYPGRGQIDRLFFQKARRERPEERNGGKELPSFPPFAASRPLPAAPVLFCTAFAAQQHAAPLNCLMPLPPLSQSSPQAALQFLR